MTNKNKLIEVMEQNIITKDKRKDIYLPFNQLRLKETGEFYCADKKSDIPSGTLTDYAFTQLLTKAEMPVRYMKKLMEQNPKMVSDQFNFWIRKEKDTEVKNKALLRGVYDDNGDFTVRGILTEKYTVLDNEEILDAMLKFSETLPDFEIVKIINNENLFYMRIVFNDLQEDFGVSPEGMRDIVKVGLDITNSEVGYSSLFITPVTFRLVCTNGLKMWKEEEGLLKKRHAHMEPDELRDMMKSAINQGIQGGMGLIEGMREAKKVRFDNPYDFIEKQAKAGKLSYRATKVVKANFDIEPEKNLFGIVNAFTRFARDLESDESRIKLEQFSGQLLKMRSAKN